MTASLSSNTQAILLLTAPLLLRPGPPPPELLKPAEYQRLARTLLEQRRQPADLISAESGEVLDRCRGVVEVDRLRRLLGRGFLLGQAVERWQTRAIWVVSRADDSFPRRLKTRMRDRAPALLYGCGDLTILKGGGLAVVGPRNADPELVRYTEEVGHLAARAGQTVVSGGARGIDLAAMRGASENGGTVVGVLAEELERAAMDRNNREALMAGRLVLVSEYDPNSKFSIGHAMDRNKLIYALADAALVVNSEVDKGGTWAGAAEQLDRLRYVPVFVRSTGEPSPGLDALRVKGARPWPNPRDTDGLVAVVANGGTEYRDPGVVSAPPLPLFVREPAGGGPPDVANGVEHQLRPAAPEVGAVPAVGATPAEGAPADQLFCKVRELISGMLLEPRSEEEVATALLVTTGQARDWLRRLTDEGTLEKRARPTSYVLRARLGLFSASTPSRKARKKATT